MKKYFFGFIVILAAGILVRVIFVLYYPMCFDEAFFGLTAKHISEFKEFPIFLSKAHYGGVLSCYIGAVLFKLFGVSLILFRSIVLLVYWPLFAIFSYLFCRVFRGRAHGLLVLLFACLTPPLITGLTSFNPGIYPETLAVNGILFFLTAKWLKANDRRRENKILFLMAFFAGFGSWLTPGTSYFLFMMFILLWLKDKKFYISFRFAGVIVFFCLGFLPAIIYNIQYPGASLFRFAGRILHLERSALASPGLVNTVVAQIIWRLSAIPACFSGMLGLIFKMASEISLFTGPVKFLVSLAGLFYFCALGLALFNRRKILAGILRKKTPVNALDGADICLIYLFCFSVLFSAVVCDPLNIGLDRYVAPLYIIFLYLLADLFIWVKKYGKSLFLFSIILLVSINILANAQKLKNSFSESPGNYKKLEKFLLAQRLLYGYSDNDVAHSLNFISNEELIFSPLLITQFEERYPRYSEIVNTKDNLSYIFNALKHSHARRFFEDFLNHNNIAFKRENIYPFAVYYGLSRVIRPRDVVFPRAIKEEE